MWFISVGRGTGIRAFCCGDPAKIGEPSQIDLKKLSVKECMMESCNEVLTFGYVDEILWCEN